MRIIRIDPKARRERSEDQALTRSQVETILEQVGVFRNGIQVRPVTRSDMDVLMAANGGLFESDAPTGRGLPLADLHFAEGIDLCGVYLADADLRRTEFLRADLNRAQLHSADLREAMLTRSSFQKAELHDVAAQSAWMYSIDCTGALLYRADLRDTDLRDATFLDATLGDADLRGATLWRADLQDAKIWNADLRSADLWRANLREADLSGANLEMTNLKAANLEGVKFGYVRRENTLPVLASLDGTTCLDDATWDPDFIIPEERAAGVKDERGTAATYDTAAKIYRTLRTAHERSGLYDVADQFAYREHVCRRKRAVAEHSIVSAVSLLFAELLFGYGFRWKRVVVTAAIVLVAFAILYWLGGLFGGQGLAQLLKSLYFSVVSFTGVGYGPWIPDSPSRVKYFGAVEALVGVFLMALFLVTFTRKYTR